MDVSELLGAVFADQATNLVIALLIAVPLLDWVTGSLRAVAGGTFRWSAFDVFVRTQLAGRTIPLTILLLLGRVVSIALPEGLVIPGLELTLITGAGIAAAVPYLVTGCASIVANVNPAAPDRLPTVTEDGAVRQPVSAQERPEP
ncbi:MAG TPA: hypothetical protein VLH81_09375 [Desulfobacterales bacterium]|nr:hypothetical protein [Desulfobacterales bacterium]